MREVVTSPGPVTFTEIQAFPAGDADAEWLELHNPMAFDLDVSGWSLAGGIRYTFADGTVMPAGGWLVVAADPARVAAATGFEGALGPYDGRLSDTGERVELYSNGGRRIDSVQWGDDAPWPVAAAGTGATLAKREPGAASDRAENWTWSAQVGGTPGASNALDPLEPPVAVTLVAADATWAYWLEGEYPAADWASPRYDDAGWERGQAAFYAGESRADATLALRVTADNFYAVYLGARDGTDFRLAAEDPDGSWWTVESFALEVTAADHLYLAAWEAPGNDGGPQMLIADWEADDLAGGTDGETVEWTLGPVDGSPGSAPADPPPPTDEVAALVEVAEEDGWGVPAVVADRDASPWGWAVAGSVDAAAHYTWTDTFDSVSETNTDTTYALFRTVAPVLGDRGATELPAAPVTALFRTSFTLDGDPASASLSLACRLDDGAAVYLNGTEVLRANLPAGPLDAGTYASAAVDCAEEVVAVIDAGALVEGVNTLAAEVHQAEPGDEDLAFGCELTARIASAAWSPPVVLAEVSGAAESPAWAEWVNASAAERSTAGLVLAAPGGELVLRGGPLAPGERDAVEDLGFPVARGDVLALYSADRGTVLDAVRIGSGPRAREIAGGPWMAPISPTPGAENVFDLQDDVVIHEIQYHHAPLSADDEPVEEIDEEWIELHNRGTAAADLSGWQIVDAVAYRFPSGTAIPPGGYLVVASDAAAMRAAHPRITVVGDFSGRLDNGSDNVVLLDAAGNPADAVRYHDDGRWPAAADGGGSTIELRDPRADNAAAEAWAASDERAGAAWVSYRFRDVALPSAVGPDGTWHEAIFGLLDEGEVLLDDVSVVQDPGGAAVELVQNGGFDEDVAHWRLLGNHRHGGVVPDPDDPGNPVLRLVATGSTGHMHNHAESTLRQPIATREYEVSFRARWVSGSNQLNARLYFNRLAHTVRVSRPGSAGTPGAANTAAVGDLGPTFAGLSQDPVLPAAGEAVAVAVDAWDPDGVAAVTLWSAVDGAPFTSTAMTEIAPGRWSGLLAGQPAESTVQFYVEALDARGSRASFPAGGPDSRALARFGVEAGSPGLHDLRVFMTAADSDWMLDDVNVMSDDPLGATVVYDGREVFYDAGVRAKGSERGRPEDPRLGFALRFSREQPFRGSHRSVLVDRSEGVGYGQREVLVNLVMTHAGAPYGEYNDLVHLDAPRDRYDGGAELQLDRSSGLVLDAQYEDGASGALFEYELVYYPLTTADGTAEGLKLPQPDGVVGTSIVDLGDDPEAYRWTFLLQTTTLEDDFTPVRDLGTTLNSGTFPAGAEAVMDVDAWLRAFAFATVSGAVDSYGGDGSPHNARLYRRPDDGRIVYFPHDLDYVFGAQGALVGNSVLSRMLAEPAYRRAYYGHLQDIVQEAANPDYLGPWCAQLGELLAGQDFASHCAFVADRADWLMYGAPDAVMTSFPDVPFEITTNGGADIEVDADTVDLSGTAWVDARSIARDGQAGALPLTWTDATHWRVTLSLVPGPNAIRLSGLDFRGQVVGTDAIVVSAPGR